MRHVSLLLAIFLLCLAYANAQRELLGKLVKGDDQSRTPVENISVSLDEDGSNDVTKRGGLFHLHLTELLRPGVEVTITVNMPGYAVYEPTGGKLAVPADLIHPIEIQLLPKGSLKFLSDAQLRAFVERTARESNRSAAPSDTKQQPDLSRYLRDWAAQYGFTVDQVQTEVSRWAAEVESRKSSAYDLGLAAFALENFSEAHDRAMEDATEEESNHASLQERVHASAERMIRDYRLAGDAAFNALNFADASYAYQKALPLTSQDGRGLEWAELQSRIGNVETALIPRSEGAAISAHEESARNAYLAALTVLTHVQSPDEWAATQSNLGNALYEMGQRSEGNAASQYFLDSVDAYSSALQVFTRNHLPQDWANTQNNEGNALVGLAGLSDKGPACQYLQQAVDAFSSALQVYTRERAPQSWATAQNDLGVALDDLSRLSERSPAYQYLQRALDAYRSALLVRTHERPTQEEWAATQDNVGNALSVAGLSESAEASKYLLQALDAYRSALLVRTRDRLPMGWANTQSNLGVALDSLAGHSEETQATQYRQQAIDADISALQIYTESTIPARWAQTTRRLASVYEDMQDWAGALKCYKQLLNHYPTDQDLQAKVKELSGKKQL